MGNRKLCPPPPSFSDPASSLPQQQHASSFDRNKTLWHKRMIELTAHNLIINDKPRYATFTHPGISFNSADRYGNPNLVSLMHFTNDAAFFAMEHPYTKDGTTRYLMSWSEVTRGRTLFVAATEISISRAMYNSSLSKWPLDVKVSVGGIGNSSLHMIYEFFIPGLHEPILTRHTKIISVDRITRKPTPYPDWFRDSLKGYGADVPNFKVARLHRPSKTFVHRVKIVWSDTDENNHTNFASYVRFGLDALHLALTLRSRRETSSEDKSKAEEKGSHNSSNLELKPASGNGDISDSSYVNSSSHSVQSDIDAVKWMPSDGIKYGVKSLRICYLKECKEGDVVDTHIWQEEGAGLSIKCSVERMDGTALSQFVLEFFGPTHTL